MIARLSRIRVYPIKSLDGQDIDAIRVNGSAGLAYDRQYRFISDDGRVVNSKRCGDRLIPIRSRFDFESGEVSLQVEGSSVQSRLPEQVRQIEDWMQGQLGFEVHAERDVERGFPDDEDASGPTIISEATLDAVASWFRPKRVEEIRRRFRANLEIAGVPAFWEDQLYGAEGETRLFQVGAVQLEAVNPCARCAVPSMDSHSGETLDGDFAKLFARRRAESLPAEVERGRFDHFYRLAVNTRIPASQDGRTLSVGDLVTVLS